MGWEVLEPVVSPVSIWLWTGRKVILRDDLAVFMVSDPAQSPCEEKQLQTWKSIGG